MSGTRCSRTARSRMKGVGVRRTQSAVDLLDRVPIKQIHGGPVLAVEAAQHLHSSSERQIDQH